MSLYTYIDYESSVGVNRYCRRAKSVFSELNQVPHVVELDERGAFYCLSVSSNSVSYLL